MKPFSRSRPTPRTGALAAFFALLMLVAVIQIPAWLFVLESHNDTTNAALSPTTHRDADPDDSKAQSLPQLLSTNPWHQAIRGAKWNPDSTRNGLRLRPRGSPIEAAGGSEDATAAPLKEKTAFTSVPHRTRRPLPTSVVEAYEGAEAAALAGEEGLSPHVNAPLTAAVLFRTSRSGGADDSAPYASVVTVCGTCIDLLPLALLDAMPELQPPEGRWAELVIAIRPRSRRPTAAMSPGKPTPLSDALHPRHPPLLGGSTTASDQPSIEDQLQTLADAHRVSIVIVGLLQGGEPSHRHDIDALAWSHVLPLLLDHVAEKTPIVAFIGPNTAPLVRGSQLRSSKPSLLAEAVSNLPPHGVAGLTVLASEDGDRPVVVSAGLHIQRGVNDEPLLVDRWAGFSAFDARIVSNVTAGAATAMPSPYFFVAWAGDLRGRWRAPSGGETSGFATSMPRIERRFHFAGAAAGRDKHVDPQLHAPFIEFVLSALRAGASSVHVTPVIDPSQRNLPVPSVFADIPGWTATGPAAGDVGLSLHDVSTPLALEYSPVLESMLPGRERALDSRDAFLSGVALKWDTFCLRCFGFSNEVMHYLRPLEGQVALRSKLGVDCFCPGTPRAFTGTLARLSSAKKFESSQKDSAHSRDEEDMADQRREKKDHGSSVKQVGDVNIFISHKDPGSFPSGRFDDGVRPDVVVGRAMYEFTKVPAPWLQHEKDVDEIWVPSRFARAVFISNGFSKEKLFVLPEPLDVFYYDPVAVAPVQLPIREVQRRWKHASNIAVIEDTTPASAIDTEEGHADGPSTSSIGETHRPAPWLPKHVRSVDKRRMRAVRRSQLSHKSHFNFLSVFKWEERKAWDVLLRAYFRAFTADDPVSLHIVSYIYGDNQRSAAAMMTKVKTLLRKMRQEEAGVSEADDDADGASEEGDAPLLSAEEGSQLNIDVSPASEVDADTPDDEAAINDDRDRRRLQQHDAPQSRGEPPTKPSRFAWPDVAHIEIISEQLSEDELLALYRSADAFVLPTRGEGWGLPIIQAMAMGLPTIATNWSGNVDFMTTENSYLLKVDYLEPVPSDTMYGAAKGKLWAQPSESHLTELMRHVVAHREEARVVGRRARQHIVAHYSEEVIAEVVKDRLRVLRDQYWQRRLHRRDVKDVGELLAEDEGHLII